MPAALDRIVARATARGLEARYASASDMLTDVENYLAAFRSSSRSVLRLVRSLTGGPIDQTGAGGFAAIVQAAIPESPAVTAATKPAKLLPGDAAAQAVHAAQTTLAPAMNSDPTAQVERIAAKAPRPAATTRGPDPVHAHARLSGQPPQTYQPPPPQRNARPERPDEPHTSAVGRGEIAGTATHSSLLRGSGSAEHNRFTRNAWQRRIGTGAIAVVALVMLGGIVAGARSLLGRGAGPRMGSAAAATAGKGFVLMTFMSTPAGARVIDAGGRILGQTPTTLPVPIGTTAVQYRFEKEGFRGATASEIANGDKTIEVELRLLRKPEKTTRKTAAEKRAARAR